MSAPKKNEPWPTHEELNLRAVELAKLLGPLWKAEIITDRKPEWQFHWAATFSDEVFIKIKQSDFYGFSINVDRGDTHSVSLVYAQSKSLLDALTKASGIILDNMKALQAAAVQIDNLLEKVGSK